MVMIRIDWSKNHGKIIHEFMLNYIISQIDARLTALEKKVGK